MVLKNEKQSFLKKLEELPPFFKEKGQVYPFNDFEKDFFIWEDDLRADMLHDYLLDSEILDSYTWKNIASDMRRGIGLGIYSHTLSVLMVLYDFDSKRYGEKEALFNFHASVECSPWDPRPSKKGFIDSEQKSHMHMVVALADWGNLQAAQLMVRACPETLRLPFVQDVLIQVLKAKQIQSELAWGGFDAKCIRDLWAGFMPSIPGGKVIFPSEYVKKLVLRCQKEEEITFSKARRLVAESLGVSERWAIKHCLLKEGRGRPIK